MLNFDDTICALATPPGIGGLGVIRVSGPTAFELVDRVTQRRRRSCAHYGGHTLHRADIVNGDGASIDDVLLAVFHSPRSYTGEDVVEISGHGGMVPLRRILARLLAAGCREARPGEFTQRAFLNGKMDLAQAEAVADIIAAQTDEALRLARRQQTGRLSERVTAIRDIVLGVLARIEASIDFPEEVGELDCAACDCEIREASTAIVNLLATANAGIIYREGAKLVLVGRPNVGKSSLLNALLRTARAIVTPIPGTTRDVVEESLNIRGIPIRAADTAGLRETDDIVERIGVERTRAAMDAANLVIFVVDAVAGETPEDTELRSQLSGCPYLVVWNKADLAGSFECPEDTILVSAVTGSNLELLESAIADTFDGARVAASDDGAAVITHARHRAALELALQRLDEARATISNDMPPDFISIDVRGALIALGEITGETATDDIINEIFARFCIGK